MRAAAWLLGAGALLAHDAPSTKLTWNREISRLVGLRCVSCHQPGGAAPFSLRSYDEARPWAVAIKEEVLRRRMPPWPAAKGFGEFANDISLPQEEINRLAEWAEGGAPEGEPQYRPTPQPVTLWRPTPLPTGRPLRLNGRLAEEATILAVRQAGPGKVEGKTWAVLPNGQTIPLVWFTGAGKPQWLIYREPVRLVAGTVIRGSALEAVAR